LITLIGTDLATSIGPHFGDVTAAIQTIFARAEIGQSEPQTDPLALSLVAMMNKAMATMLNAIGSEVADANYTATFSAPDWDFPAISGASPEANALVISTYALLQDCAEMLAAAQRYRGAVLAGDDSAQILQNDAFNAAFAEFNEDRTAVSNDIDALLPVIAVDANFSDHTRFDQVIAQVDAFLPENPNDPPVPDPFPSFPVLEAWASAMIDEFPALATPGDFLSGLPTAIADDVYHALTLIVGATPGVETGSVKTGIAAISDGLPVDNQNPVITVTGESGDALPLVEAGIDGSGNPIAGTTTHTFDLAVTDPDLDSLSYSKLGWTLVSGTTYGQTGIYGSVTFNTATKQLVYTLNNSDADTQALGAGEATIDHFAITVYDAKGGFDKQDFNINIEGTNDRPVNLVPSITLSVIENTDLQFGTEPYNSIQISDDSATLTVTLSVTNGTLTFSGIGGLSFTEGDGTDDVTMTFSGSPTDINAALQGLTFSPAAAYQGPGQLIIQSTDTEGFIDTDTVNLNIHELNGVPVANNDRAAVNQYATISGNVILGDAGGGVPDTDPDDDSLSVIEVQGTAVGQAVAGTYGVLTLNASGSYTYTANDGQPIAAGTVVEDVFTYLLTDQLDFDQATLTISVTGASTGTSGDNHLLANDAGSTLSGLAGNDILEGAGGTDIMLGGTGADTLFGGLGADRFKFNVKTETPKGANHDVILDFSGSGGEADIVDLSGIDAKKGAGNQAFKFIGAKKFHHKMGELQVKYDAATDIATVSGDIDGNGKADFQIEVHSTAALVRADFIL
jgi:VCBS repeat-containing protein